MMHKIKTNKRLNCGVARRGGIQIRSNDLKVILEGGASVMLQTNQVIKEDLESDLFATDCGYLKLEFKEEEPDPKDTSSDAENKRPQQSNKLLPPNCIKVEPEDRDDVREFYSESEGNKKVRDITKDADNFKHFQTKNVIKRHSQPYPSYIQGFGLSQSFCDSISLSSVIQEVLKGRQKNKDLKKIIQISVREAERILRRREQNRQRKALQRAQETEEQRQLRREKDRIAKAALRAAEPLEKRIIRREKDRIARALSRARETEEHRRQRLERQRVAMATFRAAQSEEAKLIRREKDRIKKAAMRKFETEEQKLIRREKDRLKKAELRKFETEEQKRIRREKNRIARRIKTGSLSCQKNYVGVSKDGLIKETKLPRAIELVEFPMNIQSIKLECLNKVDDPLGFRGENGVEI